MMVVKPAICGAGACGRPVSLFSASARMDPAATIIQIIGRSVGWSNYGAVGRPLADSGSRLAAIDWRRVSLIGPRSCCSRGQCAPLREGSSHVESSIRPRQRPRRGPRV